MDEVDSELVVGVVDVVGDSSVSDDWIERWGLWLVNEFGWNSVESRGVLGIVGESVEWMSWWMAW